MTKTRNIKKNLLIVSSIVLCLGLCISIGLSVYFDVVSIRNDNHIPSMMDIYKIETVSFWNNQEFQRLFNQRPMQIILICIISMSFGQVLKFLLFSIKNKKIVWSTLVSTGGFPSSHTSLCMTLVTTLFLFQRHDLGGKIDESFAVAIVVALITIYDAMGIRLEASKHAKILNNLTEDMTLDEKKSLGFDKKGFLKEMLGHKAFEVFFSVFFGIGIGVVGYFIFV